MFALWVGPFIAWVALQGTALVGLRGVARIVSIPPVIALIVVLDMTYTGLRQHSNLWWLFVSFASPPGAIWNLLCILLSSAEPKRKKRLLVVACGIAGALSLAYFVSSAIAGARHRNAVQRQESEAEMILLGLGPRVLVSEPRVEGTALHPAELFRVVQADSSALGACYRMGLRTDPEASGDVLLNVTVGFDGRVAAASVTESSGARAAEQCIVERIRTLEFPQPRSSSPVSFALPLRFDGSAMQDEPR